MAKILIVDDDDRVRELLQEILECDGYEVAAASGGHQGLILFDSQGFDAVFTDLGMPGMSGWEFARAIRERNGHLPLAVITGWGEAISTSDREAAGVDWIVTKPFSMAQIAELAEEVSRRQRQK